MQIQLHKRSYLDNALDAYYKVLHADTDLEIVAIVDSLRQI